MSQRKPWTQEQDNALRYLKQELRIGKWSTIAQKMHDDYKMTGRSGKQCRQRYHNHLDSSIVKTSWSKEEEIKLFQLHDQIGNKWAIIAQQLPGRTDNCVKNHFYSKLRKSVRKLNKTIHDHFKKQYKEIKTTALYKMIEANQERHKNGSMMDEQQMSFCVDLKNRLLNYSDDNEINSYDQNPQFTKAIIHDVHEFNKMYKRQPKKTRKSSGEHLKVQDLVRPRVKSNDIALDQSQEYQGSFFDQSPSQRSKVEENGQLLDAQPQKISRTRSHSGHNKNLFSNPFAEMKVERPPSLIFENNKTGIEKQVMQQSNNSFKNQNGMMTDSQDNMKMISSFGSEANRMIQENGIEYCLRNAGMLEQDNNLPMISSLNKNSSNMSNQPDEHFSFQDSVYHIKTFNPYANVKKISFTEQILEQQS